jgi:hypothetical protein
MLLVADKQLKILKLGKENEKLDKTAQEYIWQDPQENSMSRTGKEIKESYSDTKQQNLLTNTQEQKSLIFYYHMKLHETVDYRRTHTQLG